MSEMVSACIICYNQESYIAQAIEGALKQELNYPYEILISDDCSTDGTGAIVREYAKRDHKIRLVEQKVNLGMQGNWKAALNGCRGKYIAICEGDDYWTDPLKLQKQVDFLEANDDFALSFHDARSIDQNGQVVHESELELINGKCDRSSLDLICCWQCNTLTAVFRNGLLKPLELPANLLNMDNVIFSILGIYGKGKYHADITPAVYNLHSGGVWTGRSEFEQVTEQVRSFRYLANYHNYPAGLIKLVLNKSKRASSLAFEQKEFLLASNNFFTVLKYGIRFHIGRISFHLKNLEQHAVDFYRHRINRGTE